MSFSGGNSGSSRIATSADVALNNPTNNQALVYAASSAKWTNQALPTATSQLTNDGAGTSGEVFAAIKGATRIEVVTVLPTTPDPDTLYFVTGS